MRGRENMLKFFEQWDYSDKAYQKFQ